jgi:hypothetical protein
MSMSPRSPSDTSVTFSLAELAKLEEERVRDEERRHAAAKDRAVREARAAEAARRDAEAQRRAADEEARARRERAEAEEQARRSARERADMDVARIQADARVKLDADNAARAHELAVLRARAGSGGGRAVSVLAAALALVMVASGVATYRATTRAATLELEVGDLRDGQQALARERERAKATELSALERRYAGAVARYGAHDADEARAVADTARTAAAATPLDQDRLRAFADALDALDARHAAALRVASLDRRRDDLLAWAGASKRSDATAAVRAAAVRARALGDEGAAQRYEAALDQLRESLARDGSKDGAPAGARPDRIVQADGSKHVCIPGDPACGLDGKPIF